LLTYGCSGNDTSNERYDILVEVLVNNFFYVERPKFSSAKNVLPFDCSGLPKSSFHSRLQEHRDGCDGIIVNPEFENRWQAHLYPRDDRWWRSLDLVDKVGATQMSHVHNNGA